MGRGILRMANRVAYLTATAALEATTARILAATLLARTVGQEEARRLAEEARARAARRLRERMDEHLAALIPEQQ